MSQNSEPEFNKISFFSKISHELRTPIHGISGLSDYLRDNWPILDDDIKKSCITDISKAGNLLKDLVEKFFELCCVHENNISCYLERINIVKIVEKTVENNNLFILDKNSINLFLECNEKEIYVDIDQFWISRLLSNLISNAIKHSDAKNIQVKIDLQNNSSSQNLIISVADDGIGIPKGELNTIFDPFRQSSNTKNFSKGSGLGLTICKEVIKAHGGEIWAKNNDEGGTTMSFNLPIRN